MWPNKKRVEFEKNTEIINHFPKVPILMFGSVRWGSPWPERKCKFSGKSEMMN